MFLPFSIMSSQNMLVFLLFPALCLVFLAIQLLFFRLLFRVAFYKDYASFSQLERRSRFLLPESQRDPFGDAGYPPRH